MAGTDPNRFNESDKATDITLSNNDLTAAHTGSSDGNQAVRCLTGYTTGKLYFEIHIDQRIANSFTIGWMDASHSLDYRVGEDGTGVGIGWHTGTGRIYHDGTYTSYSGTATDDDYVMVAVDLSTGDFWFGVNGAWLASGDPANGTNPSYTESEAVSATMYPAVTLYDSNNHICTIRTNTSNFEGTVPSGFSAITTSAEPEEPDISTQTIGLSESVGGNTERSRGITANIGFTSDTDWADIAGQSGNLGLSESVGATTEWTRGISEGIGLSDDVGITSTIYADISDGVGLSESVGYNRESTRGINSNLSISESIGAFNFSAWLRSASEKIIYRYYGIITGYPDGVDDLDIGGMKSLQYRMRNGEPSYLSVVLPYTTDLISDINDRPNGEIVINMSAYYNGQIQLTEELIRVVFDNMRFDRGAKSQSITITGYKTVDYSYGKTVQLVAVQTETLLEEGIMKYRCARPDFYLKPGDTAEYGSTQIIVGHISCSLSPTYQFMELTEYSG